MAELTAEEIKDRLGLQPLGFEGGFYRESYRAAGQLSEAALGGVYRGPRSLSTAIFYLLTPASCSLMHRLATDELYHFYLGDSVELLMLHPDGRSDVVRLGSDLRGGDNVQWNLPAGVWQGSRLVPGGRFALMGTTMAPGFDLADFELGDRDALRAAYPDAGPLLVTLTPDRLRTEHLELAAATLDLLHAELRGPSALGAGLAAEVEVGARPPDRTDEALTRRIEALAEDPRRRAWGDWYVVHRQSRALMGIVGYAGPPQGGRVELVVEGLEHVGDRALIDEAIGALTQRAFEDPGVEHVQLQRVGTQRS